MAMATGTGGHTAPVAGIDRLQPDQGGHLFLDHVGHFVEDHEAAASALRALGFRPTPWTVQMNPDPDGGPPRPTGTGNRCVMLRRGYLEILGYTADTPLGRQFRAALDRYAGIHLVAFASSDSAAERDRLQRAGFAVQPLVSMERQTDQGMLAFSVARVQPGEMPEGRIQICTHHTAATLWRPDLLDHPNGAQSLTDQIAVVDAVDRHIDRWERFLNRSSRPVAIGRVFDLERGRIVLAGADSASIATAGLAVPAVPSLPAYALGVPDLAPVRDVLGAAGLAPLETVEGRVSVAAPAALGRVVIHFVTEAADPPWLSP